MDNSARLRWRVQGVPPGVDETVLAGVLREHADLQCPAAAQENDNGVAIVTLAASIRFINPTQTATVRFRVIPAKLRGLEFDKKLVLDVDFGSAEPTRITIDRHFIGLTVLTRPSKEYPIDKQINVFAVPGLGGHPIGSFTNKVDGHLWLVDSLAQDLPFARIMVYGYGSSLQNNNSFATMSDLATTLSMSFREILSMDQSSIPLVIIAHSLGGLLVKDVLIQISNSSDDCELLDLISGVLFYGVPHRGMDITSLRAVVGDQPNRLLESLCRTNSPSLAQQRRDFAETVSRRNLQIFCFYETETSPTAEPVSNDSDPFNIFYLLFLGQPRRSGISALRMPILSC